jgi:hypothetical protein
MLQVQVETCVCVTAAPTKEGSVDVVGRVNTLACDATLQCTPRDATHASVRPVRAPASRLHISLANGNDTDFYSETTGSNRSRHSWTAWVRFPAVQDFSLLHNVHTDGGTHPASNPTGTGGSFPGDKVAGV